MHANTRLRPCVSLYIHVALVYLNAWVWMCVHAIAKASLSVPRSETAKRLVTWSIHYIRTIASSNRHAPSLWIWRACLMCACVVLFCVFQRVSRETPGHKYAIDDSTKIGEIQRCSRKSPRSLLVAVGIIVCLRSIVLSIHDRICTV